MSKDIIKKRDLGTLASLQSFLMNVAAAPEQLEWMKTELKTGESPCWNGLVRGVAGSSRRIHDILDVIRGQKTEYHHGGLTVAELFKLTTTIGIDRKEAETNKTLLWQQISRRLSPELSISEARTILYALLKTLTEDEIRWLKEWRSVSWKGYFLGNKKWIAGRATTLTECSINIEDILRAMTGETEFNGYRGRISREHLLALENRLGIYPPSQKIWPKGVVKARMLFKIAEKKKKIQASDKGSFVSTVGIPSGWEGYIV